MSRPPRAPIAAALLAAGCYTQEAPDDIDGLGTFVFAEFDGPAVPLEDAARNLRAELAAEVDWDAPVSGRRFAVAILDEDDLASVEHPDVDPALQSPVALAFRSAWPPLDHATLQLEVDHAPFEPSSPEAYQRSFELGQDCWPECDRLETRNQITKDNALYTVPYETRKHFRRLEVDGWVAIVSRTWSEEIGVGVKGQASIDQNYAVDTWLQDPDDAGRAYRLQYAWSSVTIGEIDMETLDIRGIIADGIDDTMVAQDEFLAQR